MEDRDKYGLTYVVGVNNTYHVQPEKGELPYELAEKKPLAFYREVMETNVKEHRVSSPTRRKRPLSGNKASLPTRKVKSKKGLEYRTSIKKRSVAYILNTVQRKLQRLISNVTEHSAADIKRALSNPETENVLRKQITSGSINLVDKDTKSPLYTRQMSKIGEQGYRAAQGSPGADSLDENMSQLGPEEPDEAELVSSGFDLARQP